MSRTFLMIKPSAVAAGRVGDIIAALERAGFAIVGVASRTLTADEAASFYDVHVGEDFYEPLLKYITSGMSVGLMLEAPDAVKALREVVGATDPALAKPGSIRALYGETVRQNAVHAADSPERVEHESAVYFGDCPRTLVR